MRRFRVFACLWCAAVLLHQLYTGRLFTLDWTTALDLAAVWGLLRPSLRSLTVVAALQVGVLGAELPRVSNHWMLMGLVDLGILLAVTPTLLRPGASPADRRAAAERALAQVRVQVVLLYLFATLAKINVEFFDPAASCGASLYRRLAELVPLLPIAPWSLLGAVWITLLVESALPVLLIVAPLRPLALAVGWGFHLALGFDGFWDFASAVAAGYAAFAPGELLDPRSLGEPLRHIGRRLAHSPLALASGVSTVLALSGLPWLLDLPGFEVARAGRGVGRWIWLAGWLALGAALVRAWRLPDAETIPLAHGGWARPWLWLAPLLAVANGLSPYLGLKTEHSYAMFSNLRTEARRWNHLWVPASVRVFGYQDELVWVLESTDPELARWAREGWRTVPFALRARAAERPGARIHYFRDGEIHRARAATDDPWLAQPPNPWLARIFFFRPVPPRGARICMH